MQKRPIGVGSVRMNQPSLALMGPPMLRNGRAGHSPKRRTLIRRRASGYLLQTRYDLQVVHLPSAETAPAGDFR